MARETTRFYVAFEDGSRGHVDVPTSSTRTSKQVRWRSPTPLIEGHIRRKLGSKPWVAYADSPAELDSAVSYMKQQGEERVRQKMYSMKPSEVLSWDSQQDLRRLRKNPRGCMCYHTRKQHVSRKPYECMECNCPNFQERGPRTDSRCITCGATKSSPTAACPVRASIGAKAHARAHPSGRSNPGYGDTDFEYAWIAPDGVQVQAGDTVEYWRRAGLPHGAKPVRTVKKVLRMLVFHDHVQVNYGSFGDTVDAENYIRRVSKRTEV